MATLLVSGNLLTLLSNITAVGSELEWTLSGAAIGAPMLEVEGVSFAGS